MMTKKHTSALRARRPAPALKALKKQAGSALLDALFAFFLLSIGILGVARVHGDAIQQSASASTQTMADAMARQMFERMRLNPAGVTANRYNAVTATAADPACIGTAAGCTEATLAQTDVNQWYSALAATLPQGSGSVAGAGHGSVFTVTVSWVENASGGPVNRTWTVRGRL